LVLKGMILCWLERCANPLNPVPTGIILYIYACMHAYLTMYDFL